LAKSALGAERSVDWESFDNVLGLINLLKKEGFEVLSLEQSENSIDYKKIAKNISKKTLVGLGNETAGIDKKILAQSDKIVEKPMRGKKESLNVSVATGILLYRLFDK
jgi:tRNA G18 (ribose-2'-O)-methylase SpoU